MSHDSILGKVNEALMIVLIVSSPVLIAAVAIGLLVGLLQALTQIQDQTLPQAVKLVVVLVLIILLGPVLSQQVANEASGIFDAFPIMTR
jgi:type III secretion protein S